MPKAILEFDTLEEMERYITFTKRLRTLASDVEYFCSQLRQTVKYPMDTMSEEQLAIYQEVYERFLKDVDTDVLYEDWC